MRASECPTTTTDLDFRRLQTPPGHGDVLVEPPGAAIAALAESNHALLKSYSFSVIDTDAQAMRAELRRTLCDGCDSPALLTGHQPEFIHAGVWAKHLVASAMAARLGGRAINFVVDNDAPKQATLLVQTKSEGCIESRGVRFAGHHRQGAAYEGLAPLGRDQVRELAAEVRGLMGEQYEASCMPRFLSAFEEAADAKDCVDQMVAARAAVEREFSVELIERRVSRVWLGPLLADMMIHAEKFAACYNSALEEYRAEHNVRTANRPIPDLLHDEGRCELPVWTYRLAEPRRRLFVERSGDRVVLWAGTERVAEVPISELSRCDRVESALAEATDFVFRPRALSLTLWARVFVGDLFIHGIGGAKYDRITDRIIRRYYGVDPPGMACVSATLKIRPDGPQSSVDPDLVQKARNRVRDVRFNPQRHVRRTPETEDLIEERERLVAESQRLCEREPKNRRRRREVFEAIRSVNRRLVERDGTVLEDARGQLRDAEQRVAERAEANRRDYFFAMIDRENLGRLRDKLVSLSTAES